MRNVASDMHVPHTSQALSPALATPHASSAHATGTSVATPCRGYARVTHTSTVTDYHHRKSR